MRRSTTSCCSGILLLLAACGGDEGAQDTAAAAPACDSPGQTYVFVVSVLEWGRADDATGVSDGFDLDGYDSTENDPRGCKIDDYTSPGGEAGIDNGFARVLPALEMTEAVAVEGLVAQSIASGDLLVTFELTGVDDLWNDDCVGLSIGRGGGDVLLGTDGMLEEGQTLERDTTLPSTAFQQVSIVDGQLLARPLDWSLPLTIFDVTLDLHLEQGAIRLDIAEDGGVSGVVGGAVDVDYIIEVAGSGNIDASIVGLMEALLGAYSDLSPDEDGVCQQISINMQFQTIEAFFFED